ncbi:MAG: putative lipoprotein [Methyloprofundus sp.]|nr:putative lipoprotein [Methyloprofundus sp.]MDT8425805.1 putative lipoprotein [Methyloprofundus sp.]
MQIKSYLFPVFIVAGLSQGCSFSASSKSVSDSVSSIISSPSSSSKDIDKAYQIQIMDYTTAYLSTAGFERAAYVQGLSEIATEAGISNWEDDENTLIGIGRALKKAKLTGRVYEIYKKSLADSKESRMLIIQKGYDQQ